MRGRWHTNWILCFDPGVLFLPSVERFFISRPTQDTLQIVFNKSYKPQGFIRFLYSLSLLSPLNIKSTVCTVELVERGGGENYMGPCFVLKYDKRGRISQFRAKIIPEQNLHSQLIFMRRQVCVGGRSYVRTCSVYA